MKKTILILSLAIGITAFGQIKPYLKVGIDWKMMAQGPHVENSDYSDSSLDGEIQWGLEFSVKKFNVRVSQAYQSHKEINYSKYTFLMVDYRLMNFPVRNINCYAGVEWGSITRKFDNPDPANPYNYKDQDTSMWHYGANAEVQWMFLPHLGVVAHINWFRAEQELVRYGKKNRWEVMGGLVVKTNEFFR